MPMGLLPSAVVDDCLIGRTRCHQIREAQHPLVGLLEALPSVGRWRRVQKAPGLEFVWLQQPPRFCREVMGVSGRVGVDPGRCLGLGAKHGRQSRDVYLVASRLTEGGVALHYDSDTLLNGDGSPHLLAATGSI